MSDAPRRPRVFKIDGGETDGGGENLADEAAAPAERAADAHGPTAKARSDRGAAATAQLKPRAFKAETFTEEAVRDGANGPGDDALPEEIERKRRRLPWLGMLMSAAGALLSIIGAIALERMIASFFAHSPVLGWLGLALTAFLVIALVGFVAREFLALRRLARIDHFQKRAEEIGKDGDRQAASRLADDLVRFYQDRPDTARGRSAIADHGDDVMEAGDRLALAERSLLVPLDDAARKVIVNAARRVSLVTAISPRALVDVGFVLFATVRMISDLGKIYGARPGTLGFLRLLRQVFSHLLITGGIAATDSLVEQFIGQGLAARLSARLGEGVVNGVLTARIGVAAVDVLRPLPFIEATPPRVRDAVQSLRQLADSAEPKADPKSGA